MSCGTLSSLASSASNSHCEYFTVRITCAIFKSPDPSRPSLVRYSLEKVNGIGDPCTICRSVFFRASRDQFPLGCALIWSSLHGQVPSAILWSKQLLVRSTHTYTAFLLTGIMLLWWVGCESIYSGYWVHNRFFLSAYTLAINGAKVQLLTCRGLRNCF